MSQPWEDGKKMSPMPETAILKCLYQKKQQKGYRHAASSLRRFSHSPWRVAFHRDRQGNVNATATGRSLFHGPGQGGTCPSRMSENIPPDLHPPRFKITIMSMIANQKNKNIC